MTQKAVQVNYSQGVARELSEMVLNKNERKYLNGRKRGTEEEDGTREDPNPDSKTSTQLKTQELQKHTSERTQR